MACTRPYFRIEKGVWNGVLRLAKHEQRRSGNNMAEVLLRLGMQSYLERRRSELPPEVAADVEAAIG